MVRSGRRSTLHDTAASAGHTFHQGALLYCSEAPQADKGSSLHILHHASALTFIPAFRDMLPSPYLIIIAHLQQIFYKRNYHKKSAEFDSLAKTNGL